jgi:hypothetical protein
MLPAALPAIAGEAPLVGVGQRALGDVLLLAHEPVGRLGLEGRELLVVGAPLAALVFRHR